MTDRERLIDLLNDVIDLPCDGELISDVADHLLDNGVIMPPVSVGSNVYVVEGAQHINTYKVVGYHVSDTKQYGQMRHREYLVCTSRYCPQTFHIKADKFGKTVFLSTEEASTALEKLKGGGE